jgi:hypothetical protein
MYTVFVLINLLFLLSCELVYDCTETYNKTFPHISEVFMKKILNVTLFICCFFTSIFSMEPGQIASPLIIQAKESAILGGLKILQQLVVMAPSLAIITGGIYCYKKGFNFFTNNFLNLGTKVTEAQTDINKHVDGAEKNIIKNSNSNRKILTNHIESKGQVLLGALQQTEDNIKQNVDTQAITINNHTTATVAPVLKSLEENVQISSAIKKRLTYHIGSNIIHYRKLSKKLSKNRQRISQNIARTAQNINDHTSEAVNQSVNQLKTELLPIAQQVVKEQMDLREEITRLTNEFTKVASLLNQSKVSQNQILPSADCHTTTFPSSEHLFSEKGLSGQEDNLEQVTPFISTLPLVYPDTSSAENKYKGPTILVLREKSNTLISTFWKTPNNSIPLKDLGIGNYLKRLPLTSSKAIQQKPQPYPTHSVGIHNPYKIGLSINPSIFNYSISLINKVHK